MPSRDSTRGVSKQESSEIIRVSNRVIQELSIAINLSLGGSAILRQFRHGRVIYLTPALSCAGGFIARVHSNGLLGEYVGRAVWFKRRVVRRIFACPPIMPNSAWADDKVVCPRYQAVRPQLIRR